MFCSVRHWKRASALALSFTCFSAGQNICFGNELEATVIGLEAKASALTIESKGNPNNAPAAKFATEAKPAKRLIGKTGSTSKPRVQTTSQSSKSATKDVPAETTNSSEKSTSKTSSSAQSLKTLKSTQKTGVIPPKEIKDSSNSKEEDSKSGEKTSSRALRKSSRKTGMLVPPPPPTIPTYLNTPSPISGSFDLGLSVNFMSLEDLKFQQKNLEKKLEAAKLDDKDQKRSAEDRQERAKRFVELYAEGVVSRRELEAAQDESERSARDIEQSHIKVSEIERVLAQVKERISSMEAAKRPFKVSSKKSKTR